MSVTKKEFIFDDPRPTLSCHASTIVVLDNGDAVAAWFGGTQEGADDVLIWYSRRENGVWCEPKNIKSEQVVAHWNPVLFKSEEGTLYLFYKVSISKDCWKTMIVRSDDFGKSWSDPKDLVENDDADGRGPVKNKPLVLSDGSFLAPASTELEKWRCFIDIYDGTQWNKHPIPVNPDEEEALQLIQPTLWESEAGCVHALMRSNAGKIYRSDSNDYGKTWSEAYPIDIPNNNSGIDCVMTDNGLVLVCNPVEKNWGPRSPLTVFISKDNGITFEKLLDLETEEGEFSYPAVIYMNGKIWITYTHKRERIVFCEILL